MITDTIADLHYRGFTSNFILLGNRLFCAQTLTFFDNSQFDIIEVHNFDEGYINEERTILYAIECITNTIKGILLENLDILISREILTGKLQKFWK